VVVITSTSLIGKMGNYSQPIGGLFRNFIQLIYISSNRNEKLLTSDIQLFEFIGTILFLTLFSQVSSIRIQTSCYVSVLFD
jgi:hypothetical protein